MKALQDKTRAVLMGRRTFEIAGDAVSYADTYELPGLPPLGVTERA